MKVIRTLKNLTNNYYVLYIVLVLGLFLTITNGSTFAETVDYSVFVKPSLKISISSNPVVLNLNPNSKPFGIAEVDVSIGTNNLYGYKLYMNTDIDTTTGLAKTTLERDSSIDSVVADIPTLSNSNSASPCTTSYTNTTFTTNSWGYRINNDAGGEANCIDTTSTNYYAYAPNTLISSSTTATNDNTASLTFASKIDYDKPAGQYELTLGMKALPVVTVNYIQNLDSNLCTTNPTIVIDERDEQPYTIQRLADGRCWMLDNLNLDLTNKGIVDNLSETNTNATNTVLEYLKNGGGIASDQWAIKGLSNNSSYAYANWTDGYSFSEPLVNRSGKCNSSINSLHPCSTAYQDKTYTSNTIITVNNIGTGTYKIGTYYNYCAATAGSYCYGDGTDSGSPYGNAQYSICPAGWGLPEGGVNGDNNDFVNLYNAIYAKIPRYCKRR